MNQKLTARDAMQLACEAGPGRGFQVDPDSLERSKECEHLDEEEIDLIEEYDGFEFVGRAVRTEDATEVPIIAHVFLDCTACGKVRVTMFDQTPRRNPSDEEWDRRLARGRRWGPFHYTPTDRPLYERWAMCLADIVQGLVNLLLQPFHCHIDVSFPTVMWVSRLDRRRAMKRDGVQEESSDAQYQ